MKVLEWAILAKAIQGHSRQEHRLRAGPQTGWERICPSLASWLLVWLNNSGLVQTSYVVGQSNSICAAPKVAGLWLHCAWESIKTLIVTETVKKSTETKIKMEHGIVTACKQDRDYMIIQVNCTKPHLYIFLMLQLLHLSNWHPRLHIIIVNCSFVLSIGTSTTVMTLQCLTCIMALCMRAGIKLLAILL